MKRLLVAVLLVCFCACTVRAQLPGSPFGGDSGALKGDGTESPAFGSVSIGTKFTTVRTEAQLIAQKDYAGTVVVSAPITLSADLTTTCGLYINRGCAITTTGFTLTENGPHLSTGLYQQYAGSGTVAGLKYASPDWWYSGTGDAGPAIAAAAAALTSGGKLEFTPVKSYPIFVGTSYASVAAITSKTGLNIEGNWATLAIDQTNTYYNTTPHAGVIFWLHGCSNITINHFNVTALSRAGSFSEGSYSGIDFVRIDEGTNGLSMPHNKVDGAGLGLEIGTTGDTLLCSNIDIGILEVSNSWYGIAAQYLSQNLRVGLLKTSNVYRSFFMTAMISPIANVNTVIDSTNPQGSIDVLLKGYDGNGLSDFKVKYISDASSTSVVSPARVSLTYEGTSPIIMKNIVLDFDVEFATSGTTGANVFTVRKLVDDTTGDDTDRGHSLDNLTITGHISGHPSTTTHIMGCGAAALGANNGTWGTGEYWSNIKFDQLKITDALDSIAFDMDSLVDKAVTISNVHSLSSIAFSPGLAGQLTKGRVFSYNSNFTNQYYGVTSAPAIMTIRPYPNGSPLTVLPNWFGKTVNNSWIGSSNYVFSMPAAVSGEPITFVRMGAGTLTIDPSGTEVIRGGGAGKTVSLAAGGSVTLQCLVAGTWEIIYAYGALTFEE